MVSLTRHYQIFNLWCSAVKSKLRFCETSGVVKMGICDYMPAIVINTVIWVFPVLIAKEPRHHVESELAGLPRVP